MPIEQLAVAHSPSSEVISSEFDVIEGGKQSEEEPAKLEKPEDLIPTGEALKQFENEILGHPLPPEIVKKIEDAREAKRQESLAQKDQALKLAQELQNGSFSKWIDRGVLRPPKVITDHEVELLSALDEGLKEYLKSPRAQKDGQIKLLREFLSGSASDKSQLRAVEALLGQKSRVKSRVPGFKSKYKKQLKQQAEVLLNQLAPPGYGYDDEPKTWHDEVSSERNTDLDMATFGFTKQVNDPLVKAAEEFGRYTVNTLDSAESKIEDLRHDLENLDKLESDTVEDMIKNIKQNHEIMSLLARGSVTIDQVISKLKKDESGGYLTGVSLRSQGGVFEQLITKELLDCKRRLPEPSLVGLSYDQEDYKLVEESMAAVEKLAEAAGIRVDFRDQARIDILRNIKDSQQFFFEHIDSPNNLYWHFSSLGIDLIKTGALTSAKKLGTRNTGEFSSGVHFVKPGLGIETVIGYHGYAMSDSPFRDRYQKYEAPLGIAVLYDLEEIIKTTPLRDEPVRIQNGRKSNVAEDVVFRPKNESDQYEYPLKDGYLLPFATWEQLSKLKDIPEYSDIFSTPGVSIQKLAYEVAKRTLISCGYTEDWIIQHLINPDGLVKDEVLVGRSIFEDREAELFGAVNQEIQSRMQKSDKLVVAVSARPGGFESHDHYSNRGFWQEELIELSLS